jgi:hypothetical protein
MVVRAGGGRLPAGCVLPEHTTAGAPWLCCRRCSFTRAELHSPVLLLCTSQDELVRAGLKERELAADLARSEQTLTALR